MKKNNQTPKRDAEDRSILINFVLDKSGSMSSVRDATISGFNEFKNDQATEEGRAYFTLTLFDTEFDTVASAVPVQEVADLDYATYRPGGCTALYDAIGYTLRVTDDFVAAHKPDQVLFVVMTDGGENSSREFGHGQIFQMIKDRQALAGYEFIYLGANQDSYATSQAIGVRVGHALDYASTPEGSREALKRASKNVSAHRRHAAPQREDFFSPRLETLGDISPQAWKEMEASDRARLLEESETPSESST